MSYYRECFMLISLAVVTHAAYKYFIKKNYEKQKEVHEGIMFSNEAKVIKKSKYSRCMITQSMDRLLHYLAQPRYNIDICMYVITNLDLTYALLKLHYRNVKIRIIIDAGMAYTNGSGIKKLTKHNIPVRWMKSPDLMHHKFCLSDTLSDEYTPFLMTGSLNWTNQALNGNNENCFVTTQKDIIKGYKDEFERLWILFKPNIE